MAGISLDVRLSVAIVALVASAPLATPAFSQTGGTVGGRVVDDQGQAVADASVVFELQGALTSRFEATTGDNGQFRQVGMPPGTFRMTVEKEGFGSQVMDVRVFNRETATVEILLLATTATMSEEERARRERAVKLREGFDAGLAAINAGRYDDAIAILTAALETDPDCPDCQYNIGIAHLRKKEYEPAEAAFKAVLETQPDYALAYQGLADVYSAQQRFDEAIEASAQATKLAGGGTGGGGSVGAVFGQGLTFWNAGQVADARKQFEETLRLDPNHGEAHYFLGMANLNEGQIPEAAAELQAYLDLEPNGRFAAQAKGILDGIQPDE